MYGEIIEDTKQLKIEFIEVDKKEFVEEKFCISDISSEEEIIEKINESDFDKNKYYKLILTGNKKFEINESKILKNIMYENIVKIKDKTELQIDLEKIAQHNNLKGIFVKNLLDQIEKNPNEKDKIMKAIEIGLDSF